MADSTTNLDTIQQSQSQKEVTANALYDANSPAGYYGRRASQTSGLQWGYYGAVLVTAATQTRTLIANGTITLTASTTNYIEASATTGAVTKNTTAFTAGAWPLYKVITSASAVTSYEDWRTQYRI